MLQCVRILLLAACCWLSAGDAWAQATAQISGTVRDEQGGVLPGAEVTVTQTATGAVRSAVVDADGVYRLNTLPLGPYQLSVVLSGFRTYTQTGISLQVGSSPTVNVTLVLGELTETVAVTGAAPLVDTQQAGVGEVVDNARIMELPLNGRNPTELIELAGAAVNVPGTGASTRSFQGNSGGQGLAVAGGQTFNTAYVLDGAMHNNPYDNLNLPLPFPDALQEFRVETGASAASNGMFSGASVSAVTRSGTNAFRGSFFEFWRNRRLNARSPFAARRADGQRQDDGLNRNQFGGTVGGPLRRNKLFFFTGYQGTRTDQTPRDNIAFVPTPAMLAGDFTRIASAECNAGRAITLRGPFVDNRINPALLSPAAVNLSRRLPSTSDPCGQVVFGTAANRKEHQGVARTDLQLSQSHSLFGRYILTTFATPPALQAQPDNLLASAAGGFDNISHSLTVGETWIVSPSVVNAVRLTYNQTSIKRYHEPYFAASALGIKAYSYLDDNFIASVTGGFNVGSGVNNLALFDTAAFQVSDDVTLIKGAHQIGLGAAVAQWDSYSEAHVRSPGTYTFNGNVTGLGLADFLTGNVGQFLQAAPNFLDMKQYYVGLYASDSWVVNPKLTLNYGLRWEPYFPQQLKNGYIYNFSLDGFRANTKSKVFPLAPAGFSYPGDAGFIGNNSGMRNQWLNFAPRAALAYDVTGNGRNVFRAGYSLGYGFVNAQYHLNTSVAPPWGAEIRLQNVNFDNPFGTFPGGNPFPVSIGASTNFPAFGSFLAVNPDAKNTRQHSWNVVYQRQLGSNMLVSASYIGSRTSHLWNMKALNPGVYQGPQSTVANINTRRALYLENPAEGRLIGFLDLHDDSGRAEYHGLLLSFQRRQVKGFGFSANYTLSTCQSHPVTSLPNVGTGWANPDDIDYDYGPCDSDRRHIVNGTVGYDFPQFNSRALRLLASDWRVNGIFRAQSGAPLTVSAGQDRSLNGNVTNQRGSLVSGDGYGDKSLNQWLNPALFAQAAFGTYGNTARGQFRGPSRWTIDMVLARMFRVGGNREMELRAEAFNVTNRFNWGNPVTNLSSQNFGRIQEYAAGLSPRVLQLGAKFSF